MSKELLNLIKIMEITSKELSDLETMSIIIDCAVSDGIISDDESIRIENELGI